ncbi:methionine--tRNA ligase [Pyrofollis japonicus]|uniref:methionine--tRNA ligase n=1 Tax=Pyrofollis japonicus TaxID=3060460 RepID=UPI00295C0326|nr:methionine--tRNA ligase [Pyrofollis japonicus]BEP17687.1 methionine--tRNA ligase [Pyrofollis japonicus]
MAKWVVASAWPYVNNVPHLGNLIGSILSADVFARYLRLKGEDVVFVSGSDEHGTPIEIEAIKRGVHPKQLTDQAHEYITKLFKEYGISFDNYTRTESETHKEFVREFMMKLYNNGYVFTQDEILPYCPRDKMFLPDRFVIGTCPYCGYPKAHGDQCDNCGRLLHPTELINPRCAICGGPVEFRKSKHWFFDLPKLQDKLMKWLEESNLPAKVKNYSLNWVKEGLKPRSITRDNKWGIPAPFPGAEGKTIYVWFDALLGYISATKEFGEKHGDPDLWKRYWFDKETRTVYFIGKDNIPFHAIIFPAMLMASGEPYVLPWYISATEYLLFEGEQFSKSRRWGIWIDEALELLPADYWRFVLIKIRPETKDTDFTWKELVKIVNKDMNDDIGNFVHRVLKFTESRFKGIVPEPGEYTDIDREYAEYVKSASSRVAEQFEAFRLKQALEETIELARRGNQYLNAKAPWDAIKTNPEDAATTIYIAINAVATLAVLLAPFTPVSAEKLWRMLNLEGSVHQKGIWSKVASTFIVKPGHKIGKPEPLFKKLPADFENKAPKLLEEARRKVMEKRPPLLRW